MKNQQEIERELACCERQLSKSDQMPPIPAMLWEKIETLRWVLGIWKCNSCGQTYELEQSEPDEDSGECEKCVEKYAKEQATRV